MKKLLIFMLVLGMASAASAALVSSTQGYYFRMDITAPATTIVVGDTVTIEIFVGTDPTGTSTMLSTVLNIDAATSAVAPAISNTGDWSWLNPSNGTTADGSGGYNVNVDGTLPSAILPTGSSIYSVSFVANGVGTVTVDATSGSWDALAAAVGINDGFYGSGAIYGLPYASNSVVPEPMTIALLGLGGLFLRRRRY